MMYQLIAHSRAKREGVMLWLTHCNPHTGQHKLANPYQGCKEILEQQPWLLLKGTGPKKWQCGSCPHMQKIVQLCFS